MPDLPHATLVLMGRRQFTPGERFRGPPLPLNGWILLRCNRGRGTLRLAGRSHTLAPGGFLWLPLANGSSDAELTCERSGMLHVSGALLTSDMAVTSDQPVTSDMADPALATARHGDLQDHPGLASLLDACHAIAQRGAMPDWQARHLGALLLHEIAHGTTPLDHDDELRGIRRLLDDHPAQRLMPGDLAALLNISPATLGRLFRRAANCSPRTWLDQRLVQRAARRLAEGDDPIADIAASAGFSDATVFTRLFTRLMRQSPSAYRRRNRLW